MSERIGNMAIEDRSANMFLGEQMMQAREYSEETAREIDLEVRRLVDEAFQRALRLVEENSDGLEILAEALEQREVLEAKEIRELMSGTGVPGGREPVLA